MSETSVYDQQLADFDQQYEYFNNKALQIKELAMMKPENALLALSQNVGEQLGVHLFAQGINQLGQKGKSLYQTYKSKLNQMVQDKVDETKQAVQDKVDQLKSTLSDKADELQDQIQGKIGDIQGQVQGKVQNLADEAQARVSGAVAEGQQALEGASQQAAQATQAAQQSVADRVNSLQNVRDSMESMRADSGLNDALPDIRSIAESQIQSDIGNLSANDLAFSFKSPLPAPGSTSNNIGDILRGAMDNRRFQQVRQQQQQQFEEDPEVKPFEEDAEQAEQINVQQTANASQIAKETGLSDQEATDAVDLGAKFEQGGALEGDSGKVIAGAVGEEVGDLAPEIGTEEAVAGATAGETFGISEVIGGLAVIGTTLATIFGHHQSVPTIRIPVQPSPSFSAGLATN